MRLLSLLAASLALVTSAAEAQTPPRTIGQPQKPLILPTFIVLNSQSVQLANQKLTLKGLAPNAILFADRPVRAAGHALVSHLLEEWSAAAPDSFAKEQPSATVSALNKAKGAVLDVVVILKSPKLEGDTLTFDVQVLDGDITGADGPASVFIDIVNLPVAHRTARRGAWYAGTQ